MKVAMLETLRVKDVMTEAVLVLQADEPLDQAWQRLHEAGLTGAPVQSPQGRLLGVLSNSDLADPRRPGAGAGGIVGEVMTRVAYGVRPSDPVLAAVRLMLDENIHRVLVVNDDGTLAGIVVPMDVLRTLVGSVSERIEFVDLRQGA
jgi:transcriptional regulator